MIRFNKLTSHNYKKNLGNYELKSCHYEIKCQNYYQLLWVKKPKLGEKTSMWDGIMGSQVETII